MFKKALSVFLTTLLLAMCLVSILPVSADEVYYSKTVNLLAEEKFSGSDYVANTSSVQNANIANTYIEGKTTTGFGWDGLWSTSPTTYVAPTDENKICHQYLSLKTKTGGASYYKVLKLNNTPSGVVAYRMLAEDINFDIAGTVYEFSFDVLDTISSAGSSRNSFRCKIGDKFEVGYDRDTTYTKITPVIIVGENSTVATNSIEVGGGETNGEFVTFTVRVEIGADGTDTIDLTVKESELQLKNAWSNVTDDEINITKNATLSGTVGYIGFGSDTLRNRKEIRDISIREIKTCETSADCVATVNTAIIDGSVAFNKTISADIDVESISGNNANILSMVAIKKDNKLVGIEKAEATLSTDSKTGTMTVSYTFSEENGWDADSFDADEIGVSFYVWNKDTLTPYIKKVGFSAEKYH